MFSFRPKADDVWLRIIIYSGEAAAKDYMLYCILLFLVWPIFEVYGIYAI